MNIATNIASSQNSIGFLPEFCTPQAVLKIMVGAQVLALVLAFTSASASYQASFVRLGLTSLFTIVESFVYSHPFIITHHTSDIVVESAKRRMLSQFNMTEIPEGMEETFAPMVDNYLRENNGQNYLNEYENLLTGRILDDVRAKLTVKEKKVSVEDFNKAATKV